MLMWCVQLPPKRLVEQGLEEVLRLALGFDVRLWRSRSIEVIWRERCNSGFAHCLPV
jgi:hypothetical protein